MGREIERKFLVSGTTWKEGAHGRRIRQGYLSLDKERTVRVRVVDEQAWLTIKGLTTGCTRTEFEYPLPVADARRLLAEFCHQPVIDKTRYTIRHAGHSWEVDEFHGANKGLLVAEIELQDEAETFERPDWVADEVSRDPRYFNARLVMHPFSEWPADEVGEAPG